MPTHAELFDEVVSLTGVAPVLARGMVTRALADAGVSVEDATPDQYEEAVPRLEARLKAYLPPEQAAARAQAILRRVAQLRGTPARPTAAGLVRHRVKAQISTRLRESSEHATAASAPPRSGVSEIGTPGAQASSAPSEGDASRQAREAFDDEEFTVVGRRWTADEQATLDALKREAAEKHKK